MARALRRSFSIGDVLGRAFPIWGRNIVHFALLNAIIHSPLILHAVLAVPSKASARAWRSFLVIQQFGQMLLGFMATAAVIHGVLQQLRGQPVGIGACLRVCVSRFLPVLAVGLLVGLLMALGGIPIGFMVAMRADIAAVVVVTLLTLFLLVYLYCTFWVAIPVAVVERPGIIASLRRSAALTRGDRLSIFVILLVVVLVQVAGGLLARVAIGANPLAEVWAALLLAIVLGALTAVANAVAYHDLRATKEGVGVEDLIRVFA